MSGKSCEAVAVDVGYNGVKVGSKRWSTVFPSTVGSADEVLFSLNGDADIVFEEPFSFRVGGDVASQSRWEWRRQNRGWWCTDEWKALLYAALSEATWASADVVLVVGWPTSWHREDKDKIRVKLLGEHKMKRVGRRRQTFNVVDVRVLPQGLGLGCNFLLDDDGQARERPLFEEKHLYVNVGSNNTNLVACQGLRILQGSRSFDFGSWTAVDEFKELLNRTSPGLRLADHEIDKALRCGHVYDGDKKQNLSVVTTEIWHHLTKSVSSAISQQFGEARQFQRIIFGGGSVFHIGLELGRLYPWGTISPQPDVDEMLGQLKFARRVLRAREVVK